MAFFKTGKEREKELEEKIKMAEDKILNKGIFWGKVGQIHQGLSTMGLWGVRDNGRTKFNQSKFEIYDDKILIERNRQIIQISQMKEIFKESSYEAIIILNNGDGIPIGPRNIGQSGTIELNAFVNILNNLIENNNSKINNNSSNLNANPKKSENEVDRLIELGKMYEKGLLTDEEFIAMKKKLIDGN